MRSFNAISQAAFVIFIICLSGWCHGESEFDGAPMEKAEQEALYTAIQGFVGNWWNGSDLYPDPCGWTPIQGVSCDIFDGFWYITALNIGPIHDNSLVCDANVEFRPQVFELKHLKTLSFFNCFVSPKKHPLSIPTSNWDKLAGSLETLEFRSNPGLIGQIPTSFTDLINLQSLILLENGLVGQLPKNIGNLINLKRLVLAGNRLMGQIPVSVGQLTQLLILDLSRNSLSGPLPLSIGSLTSLLKLDLSNNQLEGKLPSEISNIKGLTLLDFSNNEFTGGLRKSLEEMNSLEEMVLSNNPIGGELKSLEWKKLQNLVILDLSNIGLKGEIPDSISGLKKLRFLGLNDNNLTGNLSPKLSTLPSVSAFYLNGNNLSGELQFSESFYQKMGRRFGAWNNPNLCYPKTLMPPNNALLGVKPCQSQVNSNSKLNVWNLNQNTQFSISMGVSNFSFVGFWWVFLVESLLMVLISNRYL